MNRHGYLTWPEIAAPFIEIAFIIFICVLIVRLLYMMPNILIYIVTGAILWLGWGYYNGYIFL